ncbi:cellulose biosynthesis protein BcsC [Roseomonas indoligenes]|uniref:BCSC C-terminal domain-containing protein n=1 Tax=Roseomonas indoligenes TaxID=2820811 RepID=A0A940N243_9PROT|nr:cellulose biosynthesis protein BcsC [Pararoseomonas indoligenes]MBP0494641.1 BCSC C-terminal domain-containing protein [Pararoseomonas indoligenes]
MKAMRRSKGRAALGMALALSAWTGPALAQVTPVASGQPGPVPGAVDVLVRQAERWLAQDRVELAGPAVERALAAEPNNPAVLAVAAKLEVARGNRGAADAYLARLRTTGATPEQQSQAETAVRSATVDRAAIEEARRLARDGRTEAAAQRYRQVFGGQPPPDPYALEYYQTLSGTEAGRAEGQRGLAQLSGRPTATDRSRLAYAQSLTYAANTRADGIRRLAELVDRPEVGQEARQSWRAAIGYAGNDPAAAPLVEAYLQRYPDDAELRRRLEALRAQPAAAPADPNAATRQSAFSRLEAGGNAGNADAARGFEAVLAANPNDADALGGLGIVRLRQGNQPEARRLLERAVAAAPDRAAQWQRALDAASYSTDLAEAQSRLRRNDLEGADAAARRAAMRQVDDRSDAEVVLGELALRRGDPQGAEQRFRAALGRRPGFQPAQQGLNAALRAQGRAPAFATPRPAAPAAPRAPAAPQTATAEGNSYRAEAARVSDPAAAAAILRNAVAASPEDPWTRLDLARALRRQGRNAEARATVEELAARSTNPDAAFAAALLAEEDNRFADADALLARVPPNRRSPDMARLAARVRGQREVQAAAASLQLSPYEGRARLLALAARPDPTGSTAAAVIRAFGDANDRAGATEAARTALANREASGTAARIAIAGALLGAGLDAEATALAAQADAAGATAEQRRDLAAIRAGAAIRGADRLNESGDQADAFERLRPVLASDPGNGDANLALSRLYLGARRPEEALRVAEAVLMRDPRNLEARRGAIEASLAIGDRERAESLLAGAQSANPRDSRVALLEVRVARAAGDEARARNALEQAAAFRSAEIGSTRAAAPAPAAMQMQGLANPFARAGSSIGIGGTTVASAGPADPVLRQIQTEAEALRSETATVAFGAATGRVRSGDQGLDRLTELGATFQAEVSPGALGGRLAASVQPVTIDSGTPSASVQSLRRYGTNALNTNITADAANLAAARDTSASGVALALNYVRRDWLKLDVGTTPLGFRRTNVVGGIEISPSLTDNLRIRVAGERRAVTDSLLSWAGAVDDRTGITMGPVVRTGGRAQLEVPIGRGYAYAGGGYATFQGENVQSNTRYEAGAGLSLPLFRNTAGELTGGLDLVYFSYDKNLRYFTLGHGGYFSPQQYMAFNVPVDWRGRMGNVAYRIGGTAGWARYREDRAPFFPGDAGLQAQAEALATSSAGTTTPATAFYAGQTQSGFVGGVRAEVDWAITPDLNLIGSLRYDKAADFDETRVLVRLQNRF